MTKGLVLALAGSAALCVASGPGIAAQAQKPRATAAQAAPARTPGAGPVVVVETAKGTFEFETYPNEAPRTVEHILNLVNKGFYNGLRFHRVEPGFVIQVGDPNTRDYTKKDLWGTGGSGTPVGVSELSRKHRHVKGAVAMAHRGNPAQADAIKQGPQHNLCSFSPAAYRTFNRGPVAAGPFVTKVYRDNALVHTHNVPAGLASKDYIDWHQFGIQLHEGQNVIKVVFDAGKQVSESDEKNAFSIRVNVKIDCNGDGKTGIGGLKTPEAKPEPRTQLKLQPANP